MKRVIIVFHLILFYFSISLSAQDTNIHRDTLFANIKFRQGYSQLDSTFNDNQMHLNQLITLLDSTALDSSLVLKSITIKGSASPEGSTPMNRQLSEKRAQSMKAYIVDHTTLNDFNIKVDSSDVDWEFLSEMIASTDLPWRDEAVKIIANTPIWVFKDKKIVDGRKKQLCMLQGGHAWEYMSKNFFPALRARFRIMCEWEISRPANNRGDECKTDECETIVNQPSTEERLADVGKDSVATSLVPDMRNTVSTDSLAFTAKSEKDRKFVMLLKTNMLYDVMAIPNIGIEIPITPKWSASANWMYAWWSNDTRHRFWRIYGGDVELRRWFSPRRDTRSLLCGHHLGLYGQMLTYDIEWGGRGYLGDRWSWAVGLSYGYSLPLGKHFNIDFTLGVGYLEGDYMKYHPEDGCYFWDSTHRQKWFGPTKAEVSLIWFIGGRNQQKGGER